MTTRPMGDAHPPLRQWLTGSDLVTFLDVAENDVIGNVGAQVYLQRHFEESHHQQQQKAQRQWAPLEQRHLRFFHREELHKERERLKREFHQHPRPGAQRLIEQDVMSRQWPMHQRPFSFAEKQAEWTRGTERRSFDETVLIDKSVQSDHSRLLQPPRPNQYM